jgi:hypothetical protein
MYSSQAASSSNTLVVNMGLHPLESLVLLIYRELATRIPTICRLGEAPKDYTAKLTVATSSKR